MPLLNKVVIVTLLGALLAGAAPGTPREELSEYQLKAAFLFNFAKFVEWPVEAFRDANSPFVIGVLGENPFETDLEDTVKDKVINGHPFVIKQLKNLSELKTCHILFISKSERRRLPEIIANLGAAPVLTVSEVDRFLQAGGMVNFILEGNKVRFEINDQPAKRAGLRISSKLLNLARHSGREGR
jgi:hypothetical protein